MIQAGVRVGKPEPSHLGKSYRKLQPLHDSIIRITLSDVFIFTIMHLHAV